MGESGSPRLPSEAGSSPSAINRTASQLQAEIEWGRASLELLDNYFELEQPEILPNNRLGGETPVGREVWVKGTGIGGGGGGDSQAEDVGTNVRGVVDRLDLVKAEGGKEVSPS